MKKIITLVIVLSAFIGNAQRTMFGSQNIYVAPTPPTSNAPTVVSGEWSTSNLDVSTYQNGDVIPQVTDANVWNTLTTGAWCYYNNDPANGAIYGKLYNWYAVNDPRGLAPQGWHIPTIAEWTTLANTLGGATVAGGKLKTTGTSTWNSPNTGATNEIGFSALPGGYRFPWGSFLAINKDCNFWSSTQQSSTTANMRYLEHGSAELKSYVDDKKAGTSIRVIKD